jgi:hypothetical protein
MKAQTELLFLGCEKNFSPQVAPKKFFGTSSTTTEILSVPVEWADMGSSLLGTRVLSYKDTESQYTESRFSFALWMRGTQKRRIRAIEARRNFESWSEAAYANSQQELQHHYRKLVELIPVESFSLDGDSSSVFPSRVLTSFLEEGIRSRVRSYSLVASNIDELEWLDSNAATEHLATLISSAVDQAVSALSAHLVDEGIDKFEISDDSRMNNIFEDLIRQSLPQVSAESFVVFSRQFVLELLESVNKQPRKVDNAELLCERGRLAIAITDRFELPSLLADDYPALGSPAEPI